MGYIYIAYIYNMYICFVDNVVTYDIWYTDIYN